MTVKKIIISLIIIGFVLPVFHPFLAGAETPADKETVKEALEESMEETKKAWTEYVFPFYRSVWCWLREKVFQPVKGWLRPEAEKRAEYVREEIKEELPQAGRSLWQRVKDFFK